MEAVRFPRPPIRATTVLILLLVSAMAAIFILVVGFLIAWLTLGTR
jgi:hypothetical protein